MHCNLRLSDIAPVILGLNYDADNASSYNVNIIAQPTHNAVISVNRTTATAGAI